MTFEKAEAAGGGDLFVGLRHHAAHFSFVVFIRAEDIEELQPDYVFEHAGALGVDIEQLLRITVHVEGRSRARFSSLSSMP